MAAYLIMLTFQQRNPTYTDTQAATYKVKVSAFAGCETVPGTISIKSEGIYTFTGNGNWNVANNWRNNTLPPSVLPSCYEIIINHQAGGEGILNVPQTITEGKITVAPRKIYSTKYFDIIIMINRRLLYPFN
jgi:hypothetical protein